MPTPSCRDALSREVSDPVYDPLTGRCYRNPCAAEEDGVLDWAPGCAPIQQIYGSYEVGPSSSWASEVWWDGGGGGRRRHRRRHAPPHHGGGGRFGPPRHGGLAPPSLAPPSMRTSSPGLPGQVMSVQGGGPGRRMGGGDPLSSGRSVARPSYAYSPTYQTARPFAPSTPSYRAAPQYARASTTMRSAPMVAASRPMSMAKGMRGLGQTAPMAPRAMTQAEIDAQYGNRFDPYYRFRQVWIDLPPVISHYADVGDIRNSPVPQWIMRITAALAGLTAAGIASRVSKSRGVIAGAGVAGFLAGPMAFRPSYVAQSFSMR